MSSTRTQIYLTPQQRQRLDELMTRSGKTLAQLVREAVDVYLERTAPGAEPALKSTFGTLPDLELPERGEWDRARRAG